MENYPFSAEEAKIATYKSRMRYQKFVNTAMSVGTLAMKK